MKKEKLSEVTGTDTILKDCKCPKIDKLTTVFNSEDMNKVVDKINEIIELKCQ